ncbi:MAG: hypothetical protein ACT4NU_11870 [Chromatiales bacterium]
MIASLAGLIACSTQHSDRLVLGRYQVRAKQRADFWQPAARKAKILFQDGANPILLPDGSALWTYGDTFFGDKKPDGRDEVEGAVSSSVSRVFVT